jgi:hypothetical protein
MSAENDDDWIETILYDVIEAVKTFETRFAELDDKCASACLRTIKLVANLTDKVKALEKKIK